MTDRLRRTAFGALALLLGLAPLGCASAPAPVSAAGTAEAKEKPKSPKKRKEGMPASGPEMRRVTEAAYASTYKPIPSQPVLIRNATVLTATGDRIQGGSVLLRVRPPAEDLFR